MKKGSATTAHPIVTYACQVVGVVPISQDAFQVELESPSGTRLDYHAGQYLQLDLGGTNDGELAAQFYSIANGFNPEKPRRLQLFIQNCSDRVNSILDHLSRTSQSNGEVTITLPMGQAFLQTDLNFTHVLIASGSGISQVKCLAEEILRQYAETDLKIYWSNKRSADFYLLDDFQDWLDKHRNLSITPITTSVNSDWTGRSGHIYDIIGQDFESLDNAFVYLCGSPKMVYGTIDRLKTIGLKDENCYSDVFEYAPRG